MSSTLTPQHDLKLTGCGTATSHPSAPDGDNDSAVGLNSEPKPPVMPETWAIDLGTRTGWARLRGGVVVASGTWILASEAELAEQRKRGDERFCDMRFSRLLDFMEPMVNAHLGRIVFEDVQFANATDAAQVWASLRAAIWTLARRTGVKVFCIHTKTLKCFATGNGNAQKEDMARALANADPGVYEFDEPIESARGNGILMDDNEVDAIWVARFTAAVDRGEQMFSSVYERKMAKKIHKQKKRVAAKAKKMARRQTQEAEARIKRQAVVAAIKAAGRCCGVFRRPAPYGRAICPKCNRSIKIQPVVQAPLPAKPEQIAGGPPKIVQAEP